MSRGQLPGTPFPLRHNRILMTLVFAAIALGCQAFVRDDFIRQSIAHAQSRTVTVRSRSGREVPAVLWRDPAGLGRRDLFYGPGGRDHQPDPNSTYTFLKEDLKGSQPKFEVKDSHGVRWKAKLGTEARPETVATRLVWAAGYAADEDYFVDEIHVDDMPVRLHRGRQLVDGNVVRHVRLERTSGQPLNIGEWSWRTNPFSGSRELNGLRVLMAVINNWDLKDINNAVFEVHTNADEEAVEEVFKVKDLGSSFGSTGLERTDHANGSLRAYRTSSFITDTTSDTVTFRTPGMPDWIVLANAPQFFRRLHLRWIGHDIPRADAKWMGSVLSQIAPDEIRDAFRAAGYTPNEVDGFTAVVELRIRQLNDL